MEIKDLFDILDVEAPEKLDELEGDEAKNAIREAVKSKWVPRELAAEDEEIANKIVGKKIGGLETSIKRTLKNISKDVGLDESVFDGFKLSNTTSEKPEENAILRFGDALKDKIETLGKTDDGKNDEKLQKANEKIEKLKSDLSGLNSMLEQKDSEFSEFKNQAESEKRNFVIDMKKKDTFSKFQLSDNVDPYRKKGFEVAFNEKYKLDLDDDQNIIPLNSEGKRIPNEKGTGYKSYEEVLKTELEEANMLKKNNAQTTDQTRQTYRTRANDEGDRKKDKSQYSRNLSKAEEHARKMREAKGK